MATACDAFDVEPLEEAISHYLEDDDDEEDSNAEEDWDDEEILDLSNPKRSRSSRVADLMEEFEASEDKLMGSTKQVEFVKSVLKGLGSSQKSLNIIEQIEYFEASLESKMRNFLLFSQFDGELIESMKLKELGSLKALVEILTITHPYQVSVLNIEQSLIYFDLKLTLKGGQELEFIRSLETSKRLRVELAEQGEDLKKDIERVMIEIEELKKMSLQLLSESLPATKEISREEVARAKENEKELNEALAVIKKSQEEFQKTQIEMEILEKKCRRLVVLPPDIFKAKKIIDEKFELKEKLANELSELV